MEQSVSKGFAILSAANMLVKILSFIYIPFLLGILGGEGYGIYAATYSVYVFIYVLANSGFPVAISKLVAELKAEGNIKAAIRSFKIARSYLILAGLILGIILALTAGPVSFIINYPKAKLAIIALAPALLFTSLLSAYRGFYQGLGNMTPTAVSQVIEQIINTATTLLFAYLLINKGIEYACAGGTFGTSIAALISAVYLIAVRRKYTPDKAEISDLENEVDFRPNKKRTYKYLSKKIVDYSIPVTLSIGLINAGNLVDTWNIKSRLIAAGFTSVYASDLYGQFARYISLMNVPIAIITSLASAIFPAIAGAIASQNHKLVQNRINYALRVCLMISMPAAVGLSVLSEPIYRFIMFGEGYKIMMYGAFVLIFMSVVQIQNSILQSSGKLFQVVPNLFIGILIKIVSNYVLIAIPEINIYGALIGSFLGYIVPIILNQRIIRKSLNVKTHLTKSVFTTMLSALAMALISVLVFKLLQIIFGKNADQYILHSISLLFSIGAGSVTYFLVLALTGGLSEEDLRILPGRLRKFIKIKK